MSCLSNEMSKKYCSILDFGSKRRTFRILNITLRNFQAVKSSKQRSKHDEFYLVPGFRTLKKFAPSSLLAENQELFWIKLSSRNVPWSGSSWFLFINSKWHEISSHIDKCAYSLWNLIRTLVRTYAYSAFLLKVSYLNGLLSLEPCFEKRWFMKIYRASCLLFRFLQNFNFWIGVRYTQVSMD